MKPAGRLAVASVLQTLRYRCTVFCCSAAFCCLRCCRLPEHAMHKGTSQRLTGLPVAVHDAHVVTLHNLQTSSSSQAYELLCGVEVRQRPVPTPVQVPPNALLSRDAQLHLHAHHTRHDTAAHTKSQECRQATASSAVSTLHGWHTHPAANSPSLIAGCLVQPNFLSSLFVSVPHHII